MPKLNQWLSDAQRQLASAGVESARIDAELLLAHALDRPREYIHAYSDDEFDPAALERANSLLARRLTHEPIAYISASKEFYGRDFTVSPDTLIPRPETEVLVEYLLEQLRSTSPRIIDVGTGSGAIAVTLACELPLSHVEAVDISPHALAIAQQNAAAHGATIDFYTSDLLASATGIYHCIVANLPYVDPSWHTNKEIVHEPALALFADDHGLALIKQLITQTPSHFTAGGLLVLEADPRQFTAITEYAAQYRLKNIATRGYMIAFQLQA